MTAKNLQIAIAQDGYADISRTIEAICEKFPGKYWRNLEDAPLAERYPQDFVAEMEQSGFLGAAVPEEHGGIGLPMAALTLIVETIHAAGCNADTVSEQLALTQLLVRHGGKAVCEKVLPRLTEGTRMQSLALWEPASGRDQKRITTTAARVPDGFAITGKKRWVRFAGNSDLMIVVALTGGSDYALSLFLVDAGAQKDKLVIEPTAAMNNYGGCEVTFDHFVVPVDNLIGELNAGLDYLRSLEAISGILAAAAAAGYSRFFSSKGVAYANERVVFGNPIGKYQGIQFPLAQTYIESQGASLLREVAVALYDEGLDCHAEALIAQAMATQAAWDTADAAFTTHGGFAFAREYDVERKWREVRLMLNEATHALPKIAEQKLGLRVG